jgi:hypothetical protein
MGFARSYREAAALVIAFAGLATATAACKMDPKECAKLRESAYELINHPNACDTDKDCTASEWPGCPKAVNVTASGKMNAMRDASKKGKCEERKIPCNPEPKTYCEEGVCAFKYPKEIRLE